MSKLQIDTETTYTLRGLTKSNLDGISVALNYLTDFGDAECADELKELIEVIDNAPIRPAAQL